MKKTTVCLAALFLCLLTFFGCKKKEDAGQLFLFLDPFEAEFQGGGFSLLYTRAADGSSELFFLEPSTVAGLSIGKKEGELHLKFQELSETLPSGSLPAQSLFEELDRLFSELQKYCAAGEDPGRGFTDSIGSVLRIGNTGEFEVLLCSSKDPLLLTGFSSPYN